MEREIKTNIFSKIRSFAIQSRRVLKITKKPSKEEFKIIVKVSGIGIAVIGAIGFCIHLAWRVLG